MMNSKMRLIYFVMLVFILTCATIGFSQYKSSVKPQDRTPQVKTEGENKKESSDHWYELKGTLWPKVQILGVYSSLVAWVAIIFGIASFLIGYHSGGRINKAKIWAAITIATIVGILGRSVNIMIRLKIEWLFSLVIKNNPTLVATIAESIVYVIWLVYISGIAVYMYETFTVTAKEAYPPR